MRPSSANEPPPRDRQAAETGKPTWLLLVFSLPTQRKSERVQVWRKLKRIGAMALGPPGYLLPNSVANQEHFEWLAATIRGHKGQASVIRVQAIDDLPFEKLVQRFDEARSRDYQTLMKEISRMQKQKILNSIQMTSVHRRLEEITAIDFFNCVLRKRTEEMLVSAERVRSTKRVTGREPVRSIKTAEFQNKTWVTRPRPGIDRVSSAWLIKRFIDPAATFAFSERASKVPDAIPFDMFEGGGFSHVGDDCTFETLCKQFAVRNPKIIAMAEMIHDADLRDEKFGRPEGIALEAVLTGWSEQGIGDEVLLARGMDLFEGFFHNIR